MKKIIFCFVLATSFFTNASNVKISEKVINSKELEPCTVTITFNDSDGNTYTAIGTGETCSEARKNAYRNLSLTEAK